MLSTKSKINCASSGDPPPLAMELKFSPANRFLRGTAYTSRVFVNSVKFSSDQRYRFVNHDKSARTDERTSRD